MRALEILLERRWILKSREKELYYQIKDELGTVKKFLMEKLGYQVIVNPYLVKVEKMPATPENWMGIQEFTRKIEYVFFCMILMFLEEKEAEEQFVLSELTEYIQGQYREEQIDWTVYQYRRHLIKVIKYCVNCGILNLNDGSEENFARDDTSEVLYENTGVSRYFMKNFTQDIMGYTTPEDQAEKESLSDSDTVKLKQKGTGIKYLSHFLKLKKSITTPPHNFTIQCYRCHPCRFGILFHWYCFACIQQHPLNNIPYTVFFGILFFLSLHSVSAVQCM